MNPPELAQMVVQGTSGDRQTGESAPGQRDIGSERRFNAVLSQIDRACLSEEVLAFPIQHYLSVTDSCNLECLFCPRQAYFADRLEDGLMPFEPFAERLIPVARVVARLIGLYGLGEPFHHPRFFDFVRAAREAGAYTLTNCHGMSLRPKVNDRILESGLDQVNVSMDGATAPTFNRLRRGADLETVKRNIRDLLRRRTAAGRETPRLQIAAMVNRENLHEVPDMVRMAKDLGATQIDFSDTVIVDSRDLPHSVSNTPAFRQKIGEALALREELDIRVEYSLQKPFPWRPLRPDEMAKAPHACELLWTTWLVGKKGEVVPCCFIDWEMGNIFSDDPEAIRNGPRARALRRLLMAGDLPRECRGCGCARPLTPELQRHELAEARRMAEDPALTDQQRRALTAIIAQREQMIAERGDGNGHAQD